MATTYTVKSGDTLSKIGQQYGVPINQISGYKSGNPDLIYPGEVLNIGQTQPSQTGKFAIQPIALGGTLTSPQVNGSAAQASASFQPPLQPNGQPKLEQESDLFLSASTAPPQTTEPPASTLISPETGQLVSKPSPFKTAAEKTIADGISEIPDSGQARAVIDSAIPSTTGDSQALNFLQTDEFFNNLVKTFQEYISPNNQRKSLTETYQTMLKDSGVQALDTQLLNMKNVIEGTEDDIRAEVTKSSGFASESQILALTNSRNKQLIKNYNNLLETRNSKEAYLNNLIGLEVQDRQAADAKFEQSMNFAFQIANYGQLMKKNAIDSLSRVITAIGYSGLLTSAQNDPYTISLIEKTLGLPQNGLKLAVQKEAEEKALAIKKEFKPIEVSPGATLYDPITGKPIYTAPKLPETITGDLSSKEQQMFLNITNKYQADAVIKQAENGQVILGITDQIIADPKNAANQLKSLYVLVKNLDPTSAVREGELALANSTQSYLQQFGNTLARINEGRVISPEAATQLAQATKDIVGLWNSSANRKIKQYQSQADTLGANIGDAFSTYLGGFESRFGGGTQEPMKLLQDDIRQAVSSKDYGTKYKTRENLLDALIDAYPELTLDQIAKQVYTLIPDIK